MPTTTSATAEQELDEQILRRLRARPCLLFSELASANPFITWQSLFCTLGRLRRAGQIELVATRWDYEIRAALPTRISGEAARDDGSSARPHPSLQPGDRSQ